MVIWRNTLRSTVVRFQLLNGTRLLRFVRDAAHETKVEKQSRNESSAGLKRK